MSIMSRKFVWILSVAMLTVTSLTWSSRAAWAAELFYSNSFDSGWGEVAFRPCSDMYSWTFSRDNSTVKSGTHSARVENRDAYNNEICKGDTRHRALISLNRGAPQLAALNTPTWVGFSVFVPKDHPTNQPGSYIMAQIIGGSDGPEFQLLMNKTGNSWRIVKSFANGSADKKNSTLIRDIPVTRGEWQQWVIYRERSWENSGVTKIWVNGQQLVNDTGPNAINYKAYNNGGIMDLLTGIYWGSDSRPGATFVIYIDEVRMATGLDGYDLVASTGSRGSTAAQTTPNILPPTPTGLSLSIQ